MAGLAGAASCHELLTTLGGVTRSGGLGELCGSGTKIIELALKIVHVGPDIGLGPGCSLIGTWREAALYAKLRRVVEILCPGSKQGIISFDLAFHHVAHGRKAHAQ